MYSPQCLYPHLPGEAVQRLDLTGIATCIWACLSKLRTWKRDDKRFSGLLVFPLHFFKKSGKKWEMIVRISWSSTSHIQTGWSIQSKLLILLLWANLKEQEPGMLIKCCLMMKNWLQEFILLVVVLLIHYHYNPFSSPCRCGIPSGFYINKSSFSPYVVMSHILPFFKNTSFIPFYFMISML